MKRVRFLLLGAGVLAALVLAAVGVALNASFQTWLVHRMLAARPALHLTVGRVAAGFTSVELTDVRYDAAGTRWVAPRVSADMPLLPLLLHRRAVVSRLVADGWTLDLAGDVVPPSTAAPAAEAGPAAAKPLGGRPVQPAALLPAPTAPAAPPAPAFRFRGVLSRWSLPMNLSVAHAELGGRVILPDGRGDAVVRLVGGGLQPGSEARFQVSAQAALTGRAVKSVTLHGTLIARLATPRMLDGLQARLAAAAEGPDMKTPLRVDADVRLQRDVAGETYSVALTGAAGRLLSLHAAYPSSGAALSGTWALNLSDSEIAPFALGRPLPRFRAAGQGTLQVDDRFAVLHAAGRIDAAVDGLATISAALSGVGPVEVKGAFDLAQQGPVLSVSQLDLALGHRGAGQASADGPPVATIRALQPFAFNAATRSLAARDAGDEVLDLALHGAPLAWLHPFLHAYGLAGTNVRGELVVKPRAGGISIRSKAPLVADDVTLSRAGQPLLQDVDLSANASADYTPQAWQAALTGSTIAVHGRPILSVDARAGRLAGPGQPVKATGTLTVDLAAASAQPVLARWLRLSRGTGSIEFAASLDADRQVQAKLELRNLAADPKVTTAPLPEVTATVRFDLAPDGRVTVNAPITLRREGRSTDVTIIGTRPAAGAFDAQVRSDNFVVDDAEALAAALAPSRSPGATPPWGALDGTLGFQLNKVLYSDALQLNHVTGLLRFTGGVVTFEHTRAGVDSGGGAQLSGVVTYHPGAAEPYSLGADINLTGVGVKPLLAAARLNVPAPIDGNLIITSRLAGRTASLHRVPLRGRTEVTSKAGVFRGIPVSVGHLVENSSKLASWIASAGNAITSLTGHKDYGDITSRSQAANELAKLLAAISYDQLRFVLENDGPTAVAVKHFTLISPDIRLTGSGRVTRVPGQPVGDAAVAMEYHVRARGRAAELMKYLGILDSKPDDLGYSGCTIAVKVGGTLSKIDGTAASNRLVALAVEKTGLTEKAVDWINRLRGKSTN